MKTDDLCEHCKATGLAIMILLYLPIPALLPYQLPRWANAKRLKEADLWPEYRHILRRPRVGFIYVFFSKNARGSNRWQCYSVASDGQIYPMPSPDWYVPPLVMARCTRKGHTSARLDHLIIEQPEKCGSAWIAFSEKQWSEEARNEYANSETLRDSRMLRFEPSKLIQTDTPSGECLTAAGKEVIEEIAEYGDDFNEQLLPFDAPPWRISTGKDGTYSSPSLHAFSTLFPWSPRKGRAEETAKLMRQRSYKPDGSNHPGVVMALWDAIGSARELNGFRNEVAGRVVQYRDELALEVGAYESIENIKAALQRQANSRMDHALERIRSRRDYGEQAHINALAAEHTRYAPGFAQEFWPLDDDYRAGKISEADYHARRAALIRREAETPASAEELKQQFARIDAERARVRKLQERNAAKNKEGAIARSWPRYEEKLRPGVLERFRDNVNAFRTAADALADKRAVPLVKWLESRLFLDALKDYHPNNVADGVEFEDVVGDVIYGLGTTPAGAQKIEQWVAEAKASSEGNLVWRTIALNQQTAIEELDAALQTALAQHTQRALVNDVGGWVGNLSKMLKGFADTYKKAQGIASANSSATKGTEVFGVKLSPFNARGTDKFAVTVGEFVFRRFRINQLGEFASEKIIQYAFTLRAFVHAEDAAELIAKQAQYGQTVREQLLLKLRQSRAPYALDMAELRTAQTEALKDTWGRLKLTDDGPNAMRDARLAVVVALIEGVNFAKLLGDCAQRNDAKSWWSLASSGLTITSALIDVASVPAKAILGAESWSYQRLKLWGGTAGAVASFVGVLAIDVPEIEKNFLKRDWALFAANLVKSTATSAGSGLTLATTFTYAAPAILRLTGNAALAGGAKAIGGRAALIIGSRVMLMTVGWWIGAVSLTLQGVVIVLSDDLLQEWVERCPFGNDYPRRGFAEVEDQGQQLLEAVRDIGVVL